jgi:energy-coupling factor transport system substrate-specific component
MLAVLPSEGGVARFWRFEPDMTQPQTVQPTIRALLASWRTRDILTAAVIGVVFGVVFFAWNAFYAFMSFLTPPLADWSYGMWLVPAVLAPLIVRKPGAALFAEMVAASLSAILGSQWGPDTLLSGFIQGAAAELVFLVFRYRRWSIDVLVLAAIASALGAWVHDWWLYYADASVELQVVRLLFMGVSAIAFVAFGSLLLERSLRRAGVLQGYGSGYGGAAA